MGFANYKNDKAVTCTLSYLYVKTSHVLRIKILLTFANKTSNFHTEHSLCPPVLPIFTNKRYILTYHTASLNQFSQHSLTNHRILTSHTASILQFCQHSLINHQIPTAYVLQFCQHSPLNAYILYILVCKNKTGNVRAV
jgi:hypothetical protein